MAQDDFYLKIDTINGEVVAREFEGTMQVTNWSMGVANHGSSGIGTGLGRGKASLQDFHFVMENGKASPQLLLACCKGKHIPQAVLTVRKTGGDGIPYVFSKITFNNLVISSFNIAGSGGVQDSISFNFAKITYDYFQQKTEDGAVALTNSVVYDVKAVEGTGA